MVKYAKLDSWADLVSAWSAGYRCFVKSSPVSEITPSEMIPITAIGLDTKIVKIDGQWGGPGHWLKHGSGLCLFTITMEPEVAAGRVASAAKYVEVKELALKLATYAERYAEEVKGESYRKGIMSLVDQARALCD